MKKNILILLFLFLLAACQFNTPTATKSEQAVQNGQNLQSMAGATLEGVAKEVLQTSNYTYLLMNSNGTDTWIAVPTMEATVGQKFYYIENMRMENFQSKELNKYFDVILFVQKIATSAEALNPQGNMPHGSMPKPEITRQNIKIEFEKGITPIADLYANKSKYNGTMVTVKGVVTKFNSQIMGKNWIHIQDGTEKNGLFDLTISSQEVVKQGETVTLTGKIVLDKDFGYGYKYEVLLEDAMLKKVL
ncbi:MAG: GW dipeptide domain-containing protein [Bacteroidales bacterium]